MNTSYIRLFLLLITAPFFACNQSANNGGEENHALHEHHSGDADNHQDHTHEGHNHDQCVSDGIPSRAAAIEKSQKIVKGIGSDNANMVWVNGTTFTMGSEEFNDTKPLHQVRVDGFWMDEHEVTNAQFSRFVQATGYQTV